MWLILGFGAIVFAILNLVWFIKKKGTKLFRFFSLSLTALTICAFYSDGAVRVVNEDWGGLMDVMPTMSKVLWICVLLSILINSISLFREKK